MPSDPQRARQQMLTALDPFVDQLADADEVKRRDWLVIRPHDVDAVSRCARQAAATPPEPFENRPDRAARTAANDTLRRKMQPEAASPGAHVRQVWRDMTVDDKWPWDWLCDRSPDGATRTEAAATASAAVRHAHDLARVGFWGTRMYPGWKTNWPYPERALRFEGRPDVVTPKVEDGADLVIAFRGEPNDRVRPRLAYETLVATLASRRAFGHVIGVFPGAGRDASIAVEVTDHLLDEGIAVAALALDAALAAGSRLDEFEATPGSACRNCLHADTCPGGTAWLADSGRWRHGFPIGA